MYKRFLHGIRRAFLAACGGSQSCLPALALLEANAAKQIQQDGDLLPSPSGEDTGCLLPDPNGDEEEGDLLPPASGENEGVLLPTNGDLHDGEPLPKSGDIEDPMPTINGQVKAEDEGCLPPDTRRDENNNAFLQAPFQLQGMHFFCDAYSLKIIVITYMPAPIWETPKASMVHDDVIIVHAKLNAWVMPSPRPRVKMKGGLNYYNAHAWKHAAWACPSSPSTSSIHFIANPHDKLSASPMAFIPLRGRIVYQGHEMQGFKKMLKVKMQTKAKLQMKMRFFSLTKDILDPG